MPLLGFGRKKTKTTPAPVVTTVTKTKDEPELVADIITTDLPRPQLRQKASSPVLYSGGITDVNGRPRLNKSLSKSWYGSWNAKASPTSSIAREHVSAENGTVAGSTSDTTRRPSVQYMNNTLKRSRKQVPTVKETTDKPVEISPTVHEDLKIAELLSPAPETVSMCLTEPAQQTHSVELPPQFKADSADVEPAETNSNQATGSWLGWWPRPDGTIPRSSADPTDQTLKTEEVTEEVSNADTIHSTVVTSEPQISDTSQPERISEPSKPITPQTNNTTASQTSGSPRPWFSLWGAAPSTPTTENISSNPDLKKSIPIKSTDASNTHGQEQKRSDSVVRSSTDTIIPFLDAPTEDPPQPNTTTTTSITTYSGWSFWSKADRSIEITQPQDTKDEVPSTDPPNTSRPSTPQIVEVKASPVKKGKAKESVKSEVAQTSIEKLEVPSKAAKSHGNKSTESTETSPVKGRKRARKTIQGDHAFATNVETASVASLQLSDHSASEDQKSAPKTRKFQHKQNMVEPAFHSTYPSAHIPTYWESFGYYLSYPLGLAAHGASNSRHVLINPHKPKIKKAIAIGVHGYFPASLVSKIIGQPTGTSIKFATHAAASIRAWAETNQPDVPCEVEQVALEGEGFVADRIASLWKLLLNWLTSIRNADLILFAAHSQGVPVAITLVAKLIQMGCLNSHVKIGICAMAGVNLGPFVDYKSRFFNGSAAELFDFSQADSKVSLDYAASLEIVLRHGVRITYIGSLDDQLVSLESSLFANLTHPYVQRAVFVDGRMHSPDFIAHLVAFALRLRNLGISDHGLIRELSFPLAGSLYSGEGHSRIYDEDAVYTLALQFALESTDVDPKIYSLTQSGSSDSLSSDAALPPLSAAAIQDRRRSIEFRKSQSAIPSISTSTSPNTTIKSSRRSSLLSGLPSSLKSEGICPVIIPYETPVNAANANPYFLPWAMRGILEEDIVKRGVGSDGMGNGLREYVDELVRLFDEWKPTGKALKDVRFRLEGFRKGL